MQETWGDCAGSAANNAILVHGVPGTSLAVAIPPPLWSCTEGVQINPNGVSGSVRCSPPGLNPQIRCKAVHVQAIALDLQLSTPTDVTGTHTCGMLSAQAKAVSDEVAFDSRDGLDSMPVICSWTTSQPAPTFWAVRCEWNAILVI
jgi:hypothetical protein